VGTTAAGQAAHGAGAGQTEVNIYDVLYRMVEARPFQDFERETALKIIRDMERLNVLGTTAHTLELSTHECRQGEFYPASTHCLLCGAAMPVPAHDHIASRWFRPDKIKTCTICGEGF
jgi:hypothetical protein